MKSPCQKILVIDDDKKIRSALTIRLKNAGYGVLTASNGFEGLKLILDERPDMLLLDIWMPVGIGFSLVQYLRSVGIKNIPVIFITGCYMDGAKEVAKQLNAAAFFEKPYDPKALLETISNIFSRQTQAVSQKAFPNGAG